MKELNLEKLLTELSAHLCKIETGYKGSVTECLLNMHVQSRDASKELFTLLEGYKPDESASQEEINIFDSLAYYVSQNLCLPVLPYLSKEESIAKKLKALKAIQNFYYVLMAIPVKARCKMSFVSVTNIPLEFEYTLTEPLEQTRSPYSDGNQEATYYMRVGLSDTDMIGLLNHLQTFLTDEYVFGDKVFSQREELKNGAWLVESVYNGKDGEYYAICRRTDGISDVSYLFRLDLEYSPVTQ